MLDVTHEGTLAVVADGLAVVVADCAMLGRWTISHGIDVGGERLPAGPL
jgi:hypothetical protein